MNFFKECSTRQTTPNTMRAAAIDRFGGIETITMQALPVPEVGPEEVLIRVESAGVGAWDPFEREGGFAKRFGGTSGIGRAAAVAYAREGARVVVAGRRAAEGEETVRLIRAQGGEGIFVTTDVSKTAQVKELVERTMQKFGRLDFAFNNAGIEAALLISRSQL